MNKLHCWAIRQVLGAYADEALSPGECKVVERHLQACRACQARLQKIRQLSDTLHVHLADTHRSEAFWHQFEADITQKIRENRGLKKICGWSFLQEWREEFMLEPLPISLAYSFGIIITIVNLLHFS